MALMLLGGAGVVTTIATLVIGFANASRGEAFSRLGVLLAAFALLLLISRTRWFNRLLTPVLTRLVGRYTDLEAQDYAELLHLGGGWGVGEVGIREGDWLAGRSLRELDLRAEGIAVLGIERAGGQYIGAPRFDALVGPGDVLLLYGRRELLHELDDRPAGPDGERAHAAAVRGLPLRLLLVDLAQRSTSIIVEYAARASPTPSVVAPDELPPGPGDLEDALDGRSTISRSTPSVQSCCNSR